MTYVRQGKLNTGTRYRTAANTWVISRAGVFTLTESWAANADEFLTGLPAIGSEHTERHGLFLQGPISATESASNLIRYQLIWMGWQESAGITNPDDQPPVYEWVGSTANEPIQQHANFEAWADYARTLGKDPYDASGNFAGWKKSTLIGGDFFDGIANFLNFGGTWTKTYVTTTRPADFSKLGFIDEPDGHYPSFVTPYERNYLLTKFSYREMGGVFEVTKEWTLSADKGWISAIYTPGPFVP